MPECEICVWKLNLLQLSIKIYNRYKLTSFILILQGCQVGGKTSILPYFSSKSHFQGPTLGPKPMTSPRYHTNPSSTYLWDVKNATRPFCNRRPLGFLGYLLKPGNATEYGKNYDFGP